MIDTGRLRRQLEEVLGVAMRAETWEFLVSRGYIAQVLEGKRTMGDLADEVQMLQRAFGPTDHDQRGGERTAGRSLSVASPALSTERSDVISDLLCEEANRDPDVGEIRHSLPGGNLLPHDGVEQWIQGRAKADGAPTWWLADLHIPVASTYGAALLGASSSSPPSLELSADEVMSHSELRFLWYRVTSPRGGIEERAVPLAHGGTLEHVWEVSRRLAERYGWTESEATTFVLTGRSIPNAPLTIDFHLHAEIPALSRITLSIDPALTPREVAEQYSAVRRQVVGARPRMLSSKHMRLALFAAQWKPGQPWAEVMALWNRDYPDMKYMQETNFARDCVQAQRRLLCPEYHKI